MTVALRYTARSDIGRQRKGNQDSAYAGPRLLVVADGIGGSAGGDIASATAVRTLRSLDAEAPPADLVAALRTAVEQAAATLRGMASENALFAEMGTTLTAMLWSGLQVALLHVGDSRAYLLREGKLQQLTDDHSLVNQLVKDGVITPEEARTHPRRSLLLRALDGHSAVEPDETLREAAVGDRYLLCTDGLSSLVSPEAIHQTLTGTADPDQAALELIDLANQGGGNDNITCVVADVADGEPEADRHPVVVGSAAAPQP